MSPFLLATPGPAARFRPFQLSLVPRVRRRVLPSSFFSFSFLPVLFFLSSLWPWPSLISVSLFLFLSLFLDSGWFSKQRGKFRAANTRSHPRHAGEVVETGERAESSNQPAVRVPHYSMKREPPTGLWSLFRVTSCMMKSVSVQSEARRAAAISVSLTLFPAKTINTVDRYSTYPNSATKLNLSKPVG